MNKLLEQEWLYFSVSDIFRSIEIADSVDLNTLEQRNGGTRYIGRTRYNNGVTAFVDTEYLNSSKINKGGCITVAMVGDSTCSTFYQDENFVASQNILIIRSEHINKYSSIFLSNIILKEKYRFSYGRTISKNYFEKMKFKMPSINGKIDWHFIEEYIKTIEKNVQYPNTNSVLKEKVKLDIGRWKDFELNDLFKIKGSKTTPLLELEEYGKGKYPYVTTQATNNGIEGFFDFYSEDGNILTADSAVLGYCSYQPLPFSASDHVEKLIPKFKMSKYVAMFLVTILNLEQYRYNYGRKSSQERMEKISIKLPSKNKMPDFEYMENYIKSLAYSASL